MQRGQHAAVDDGERGAEPLYEPGNVDMAGAGLELPVVPEGLSGRVKLVQVPEQARGVRRQLAQVQFGQHPGELLGERAEAVPLLLLEVRFQGLGGQSRIAAVELAALHGLADALLQRKFQRVPVVVGDRKKKAVTRAPSFSRAPIGCSSFGLGGSRGDGLWRSLVKGHNDTTAPGFPGAADRLQGDAPQSAG